METVTSIKASSDLSLNEALVGRLADLEKRVANIEERAAEDRVTLIVFSGDLDRALAAFIIATGAAAMGQQVSMFFTFWGLSVLKRDAEFGGKSIHQKMMALMSPGSSKGLPVYRPFQRAEGAFARA